MTRNYGLRMLAVAALCYGVISVAQNVPGGDTKSTADGLILSQSLPPMKGDELKITVLEVAYAPGAASPAHCHPCPVVHTNCLTCCPRTPTRSAPTRDRNLDRSRIKRRSPRQASPGSQGGGNDDQPCSKLSYLMCRDDNWREINRSTHWGQ